MTDKSDMKPGRFQGLSKRSLVIYGMYALLLAAGFALALALLICLAGYFIADWEDAPVPQISVLIVNWAVIVFIPLIALKLALRWSLKKDGWTLDRSRGFGRGRLLPPGA